jgi:hypothetical protein
LNLLSRREIGEYGGRELPFLGLSDLIRSKETERTRDWDDVAFLEEFLDSRLRARYAAGTMSFADALVELRSRRGFDMYLSQGAFKDRDAIQSALARAINPVSQSFLLPFVPEAKLAKTMIAMEPVVEHKLRNVSAASPLHRSLVEVVRRQYKVFCQARDRADKEAVRAAQQP